MTDPATVLVLDDEMLLARSLQAVLRHGGYRVAGPFTKADDALAAIAADRPDAALLDINLGNDRTSIEVARELHRLEVPFAFVTGYAEDHAAINEFDSVPYLNKPAPMRMVLAMAERLLRRATESSE